jgi:hypothetical protein
VVAAKLGGLALVILGAALLLCDHKRGAVIA